MKYEIEGHLCNKSNFSAEGKKIKNKTILYPNIQNQLCFVPWLTSEQNFLRNFIARITTTLVLRNFIALITTTLWAE